MKFFLIFTLSVISLCSYTNAQNYCESLTYTKIDTHLIKCSFKKITYDKSNLNEFLINNISSSLFVDYQDLDQTLYIIAVFRDLKFNESYKINLLDLDFENITLRNKGFSKLNKSYNVTEKITEFINEFKSYISDKFNDDNVFEKMEKFANIMVDDISNTFKKNKDDIRIYHISIIHRNELKHCIDIKKNSIKCLRIKI